MFTIKFPTKPNQFTASNKSRNFSFRNFSSGNSQISTTFTGLKSNVSQIFVEPKIPLSPQFIDMVSNVIEDLKKTENKENTTFLQIADLIKYRNTLLSTSLFRYKNTEMKRALLTFSKTFASFTCGYNFMGFEFMNEPFLAFSSTVILCSGSLFWFVFKSEMCNNIAVETIQSFRNTIMNNKEKLPNHAVYQEIIDNELK